MKRLAWLAAGLLGLTLAAAPNLPEPERSEGQADAYHQRRLLYRHRLES